MKLFLLAIVVFVLAGVGAKHFEREEKPSACAEETDTSLRKLCEWEAENATEASSKTAESARRSFASQLERELLENGRRIEDIRATGFQDRNLDIRYGICSRSLIYQMRKDLGSDLRSKGFHRIVCRDTRGEVDKVDL